MPILAALIYALIVNEESTFVHIPFGLLAALAMPTFILSRGVSAALEWKPLAYVGTRAYGIYLVHIIVLLGVSRFMPHSADSAPMAILLLVVVACVSLAVAEILWRLVENPMIGVGRRLTYGKPAQGAPRHAVARPSAGS